MTDAELFLCIYATAGEDEEGFTVPVCTLSELPCDVVLRYGDEGCKYTKGEVE